MVDECTDEELLAAVKREPEAFGVFYRRHVTALLGYFVRGGHRPLRAERRAAERVRSRGDGRRPAVR